VFITFPQQKLPIFWVMLRVVGENMKCY